MTSQEKVAYQQITDEYRRIRPKLWKAKGHICEWCGDPAIHLHHVIPRAEGGDNSLENIIPLCGACHSKAHGWARPMKNGTVNMQAYNREIGESVAGRRKTTIKELKEHIQILKELLIFWENQINEKDKQIRHYEEINAKLTEINAKLMLQRR